MFRSTQAPLSEAVVAQQAGSRRFAAAVTLALATLPFLAYGQTADPNDGGATGLGGSDTIIVHEPGSVTPEQAETLRERAGDGRGDVGGDGGTAGGAAGDSRTPRMRSDSNVVPRERDQRPLPRSEAAQPEGAYEVPGTNPGAYDDAPAD